MIKPAGKQPLIHQILCRKIDDDGWSGVPSRFNAVPAV